MRERLEERKINKPRKSEDLKPMQVWRIFIEGYIHTCVLMSRDKYPGKYTAFKGHYSFQIDYKGPLWTCACHYEHNGAELHWLTDKEILNGLSERYTEYIGMVPGVKENG